MASSNFALGEFMRTLENWGLTDVLLPFLLIFTLTFSVLEKTSILGQGKRNLNSALSVIMALLVVIPHVTGNLVAGYDPVLIINSALPSVSLLIVAVVMLLILIGVFAHDKVYLGLTMPGWIAFFAILSIIIIFGDAAGWWATGFNSWLDRTFGSDALAILIMLLVFGIIIAFVTGGGDDKEKVGAFRRMGFDIGKLFGGGKP